MFIKKNAIFDTTKKYRYLLMRQWSENNAQITWIMLNPSTADENIDDPTIRRCIGFSKLYNAGKMEIVNLFSYRSTTPQTLYTINDPIGKETDQYILNSVKSADKVIIAWGNHGKLNNRSKYVINDLLSPYHNKIYTLKLLKNKEPGHPLYISYSEQLKKLKV